MKKLALFSTVTILIFALATTVLATPSGPAQVKYSPKMGTVTFNHNAHQKLTECNTCHHTNEYAQCKSCHGVDSNAPKAKVAYHKQCKSCHKKMKQGPIKCKECHQK